MEHLPSYVITVDKLRMRSRFRSNLTPTIFEGIKHPWFAVGCMLSHLALWKKLTTLFDSNEYVVCFEDDASLCRKVDNEDNVAVSNFLNNKGDLLMLGHHPDIHLFCCTAYNRLLYGHSLDMQAYIIRVGFAKKLHDKYASRMQCALNQRFFPLGAIDTLLLIHKVHAIHPMLYIQANEQRYFKTLTKEGTYNDTQVIKTAVFLVANRLWLKIPFASKILGMLVIIVLSLRITKDIIYPKK